ncbi:MAG: hypothetical protein KGZ60_06785 [Truepera sp.]|nr:hypothetical protein [Truepera sp.]
MNRQSAIQQITDKLEHLDSKTLEGLRVLVARLEPHLSASGLPYTGDPETDEVLDDPAMVERILAHKRQFEGLTPEEEAVKLEAMRKSGQLIPLEQVLTERQAKH